MTISYHIRSGHFMFSFYGSKKIKAILIVNILFLIILNIFMVSKLLKIEKTRSAPFNCNELKRYLYDFHNPQKFKELMSDSIVMDFCSNFTKKDYLYDVPYFEPDNQTYLMNFYSTNILLREISNINLQIKNQNETLGGKKIELLKDQLLVIHLIKSTQIKNLIVVEPLSKIYIKIFENEKFYLHFILFVNIIFFMLSILLTFYISKFLFPNFPEILRKLLVISIFLIPLNFYFYLSFFKEPIIVFSFLILIFYFTFFYKRKIEFFYLLIFTLILILNFELIIITKHPYFVIYFAIFLIINFIIFFITNSLKEKILVLIQTFLIIIISTEISPPNINYSFLDFNKFDKKIKKYVVQSYNDFTQDEKFFFNEKKFEMQDFDSVKPEIIFEKKEMFSNEYKISRIKDYNHLICEDPFFKICKKINTFFHTIYYTKHATLWENRNNINVINSKKYYGTLEIIYSIPFATIKGLIMPIKFSSNLMISGISIIKISLFFLLIMIMHNLYKKKDYLNLNKIIFVVILMLPLGLAIDLIASNFFTYLRYVMPINIILFLIILFSLTEIFLKKNDQYIN